MSLTPDHTPEATVTLHKTPLAPEAELALVCAKANAEVFRKAGYTVHSVEVMVHQTASRELAYGHAIGGSK